MSSGGAQPNPFAVLIPEGYQLNSQNSRHRPTGAAAPLEEIDVQILQCLAEGYDSARLCRTVGFSDRTIKQRIATLCARYRAENRTHLVALAIRTGLI